MNDSELIKGCLKHHHESMKIFYERFYAKMFGLCLRYAKSNDEAKEMVNEGFVTVFRELKHYKSTQQLDVWMKEMMIQSCIASLRKNKENMIISTVRANQPAGAKLKNAEEISDDEMFQKASKFVVLRAIQELTPAYRKVYNMHVIDGYTHAKIAEMLNIGEQTSEQTLTKAQYEFRKNIKQLIAKNV